MCVIIEIRRARSEVTCNLAILGWFLSLVMGTSKGLLN